jgi:hypothetical protein
MSAYLRVPFMYSTLLVAVPTGVKFFSWTATIWRGKLRFPTPMLYVLGAIVVFLLFLEAGKSAPQQANEIMKENNIPALIDKTKIEQIIADSASFVVEEE